MNNYNKIPLLLVIIFCFCLNGYSQDYLKDTTALSIVDKRKIYSKVLNHRRSIDIYLPPSYNSDKEKKFPVIYLIDEANDGNFMLIARIVQFGSYPWINIMPESIVIGIGSTESSRKIGSSARKNRKTANNSTRFIDFIDYELIPLINKRYRVRPKNTVIGAAFNGYLVSEILIKRPHVFDNYIILSPTLWWDNSSLLKLEPADCMSKKTIFIGVGNESRVKEQAPKEMYKKLKDLNKKNLTIFYEYYDDLDRSNIIHLGTYRAFNTIFKSSSKMIDG